MYNAIKKSYDKKMGAVEKATKVPCAYSSMKSRGKYLNLMNLGRIDPNED